MRLYDPVAIARQFVYIRELAGNHGQRVEALQRWCGGIPGQSWCCHFATYVLDICYQGKSEIPRTGDCDVVFAVGKSNGWLVLDPQPGDLVLSMASPTDAHHIGIITSSDPLTAIAGNTSADGTSSNGDGVYEHEISPTNKIYVRVPA